MKVLYLVRHAKSSWDYPELSDFDRPLNKRGKRDSPEMGRRLAEKGILPDLMLTSPANRALTTCKNIAEEINYPIKEIAADQNIYHAGVESLLKVVQQADDKHNFIMLFGHNPGFTDFANSLAGTSIYNIPTCGIFACQFQIDKWNDVALGNAEFLFYDYPKNRQ